MERRINLRLVIPFEIVVPIDRTVEMAGMS
jgi:hypothetical protein